MREISASAHARARVSKDARADARRSVCTRGRAGMRSGPPPAAPLHHSLPLGFYCRGPREAL
jgi:hypothetical protein